MRKRAVGEEEADPLMPEMGSQEQIPNQQRRSSKHKRTASNLPLIGGGGGIEGDASSGHESDSDQAGSDKLDLQGQDVEQEFGVPARMDRQSRGGR